jgi:hypothetical protein
MGRHQGKGLCLSLVGLKQDKGKISLKNKNQDPVFIFQVI